MSDNLKGGGGFFDSHCIYIHSATGKQQCDSWYIKMLQRSQAIYM